MQDNYIKYINKLYNFISDEKDTDFILTNIKSSREELGVKPGQTFSDYYLTLNSDRSRGVVYTPPEIADYMIKNTVIKDEIISNPFIRIVDPSCGCGNILIRCYLHLKRIYQDNLPEINSCNNMLLTEDKIAKHIIDNNLFGIDIDEIALKILSLDMFELTQYVNHDNLINKDFLLEEYPDKFDVFIGNPPYVGHKAIDKEYSRIIREKFGGVFSDKGDLFYCFLYKTINTASSNGRITLITSRYFMESPSGKGLRSFLSNNCTIRRIVDYYGIRPFRNAGIDPAILFLENSTAGKNPVEIIKPIGTAGKSFDFDDDGEVQERYLKRFFIASSELDENPWILKEDREKSIIKKIEKKCDFILDEICISKQGIITGCDKAFIVDRDIIEKHHLEEDVIKPWIKSSSIQRNQVVRGEKFIIYTDGIENIDDYPNIKQHISIHRERLEMRRECRNGVRKWYELQWGRERSIFEGKKIIFPYKASSNIFALDEGSFFSADIYSLIIKNNYTIDYETLKFILNSSLYEFYFKAIGKKLGGKLYEYYPNSIMRLRIPRIDMDEIQCQEKKLFDYFEIEAGEEKIIKEVVN